jgi:hypothetical protein
MPANPISPKRNRIGSMVLKENFGTSSSSAFAMASLIRKRKPTAMMRILRARIVPKWTSIGSKVLAKMAPMIPPENPPRLHRP